MQEPGPPDTLRVIALPLAHTIEPAPGGGGRGGGFPSPREFKHRAPADQSKSNSRLCTATSYDTHWGGRRGGLPPDRKREGGMRREEGREGAGGTRGRELTGVDGS